MFNFLKYPSSVIDGLKDKIKALDADLESRRAYRISRVLVKATATVFIFALGCVLNALGTFLQILSFLGGGTDEDDAPTKRGMPYAVTREELDDTHGPIPVHYDHEANRFIGPDVRQ
tara:strand:- start:23902 stop:24252 length:351 start_codon:yes stop_codon:yes gene_type:complete